MDGISEEEATLLNRMKWIWQGRLNQLPPASMLPKCETPIWFLQTGRGWGKTRTAAEFINAAVYWLGSSRVHLVGPTAADVRDIMVEGPSGIIATAPKGNVPSYSPARRRIVWPNGAMGMTFSSEAPNRLRGPECDLFWGDEVAYWLDGTLTFNNLELGWRQGETPLGVITSTPRPVPLVKHLRSRSDIFITRGSTKENRDNLSSTFYDRVNALYGGTRMGRQELEGEMLDDNPNALWNREWIERDRVLRAPAMEKIVIGVDPATTQTGDEWGIIAGGRAASRDYYILGDESAQASPNKAAYLIVNAYYKHDADEVVYEGNQGGEMVRDLIANIDASVPTRRVHATRGKRVRAEPVAALQEQKRLHCVGVYAKLEDELCYFSYVDQNVNGESPNRMDALIWACYGLGIRPQKRGKIRMMN